MYKCVFVLRSRGDSEAGGQRRRLQVVEIRNLWKDSAGNKVRWETSIYNVHVHA